MNKRMGEGPSSISMRGGMEECNNRVGGIVGKIYMVDFFVHVYGKAKENKWYLWIRIYDTSTAVFLQQY